MRIIDKMTTALAIELQQFIADYWDEVDANQARKADEFYTEDCTLHVGSDKGFQGRAGIREFYRYRAERGLRTTRHTVSNLRVLPENANRAAVSFVVANYAADGTPPITDFVGPALVSQIHCICERGSDGYWRMQSLRGEPLFIGKEPYTRQELVEKKHS
jgi:ketosteroid isomerase-like protein